MSSVSQILPGLEDLGPKAEGPGRLSALWDGLCWTLSSSSELQEFDRLLLEGSEVRWGAGFTVVLWVHQGPQT